MAYKPVLTIEVEYEGAIFYFRSPDTAWSRITSIVTDLVASGVREKELDDRPPAELLEALAEAFVEGVYAWEGVEGEEAALACTSPNRRAIPYQDKVEVAKLYMARCVELREKKVASGGSPTSTTPPEDLTESLPSPTNEPVSGTPPRPEAEV